MLATTRTPELVVFLSGLVLYGVLLWSLKRSFLKKLNRVFSRHRDDAPNFAEISKRLETLNLDSAHFVFTIERHANLLFRQNKITLVYGRVGSRSPGGIRGPVWTLRKRVYALVDRKQTEWMKRQPDAFQFAMAAYPDSVFWADLDRMLSPDV